MILELEACIKKTGFISLRELATRFDTEPEVLVPMLDRLIEKGRIQEFDGSAPPPGAKCPATCSKCKGCGYNPDPAALRIYSPAD